MVLLIMPRSDERAEALGWITRLTRPPGDHLAAAYWQGGDTASAHPIWDGDCPQTSAPLYPYLGGGMLGTQRVHSQSGEVSGCLRQTGAVVIVNLLKVGRHLSHKTPGYCRRTP